MKRILTYTTLIALGLFALSCSEDKLNPNSIFVDGVEKNSDFDKYLMREFAIPYNIEFKYWLDDNETSKTYMVAPADLESSQIVAVLVKHLWLDVYAEASLEGVHFIKDINVRLIQLIGSGMYQDNGNAILGEAYGGKKISLMRVNELRLKNIKEKLPLLLGDKQMFQTIHHEYGHILHQLKDIPESFLPLSVADYVGGSWSDTANSDTNAWNLGFMTRYSRQNEYEDFVEIYSLYITSSEATWNRLIARGNAAGQAKLQQKVDIVRAYLKSSWNLDLDKLRSIVQRRVEEAQNLNFENLK